MNNNQDNLNINPEVNNFNNQNQTNSRFFNNQNGFIGNQQVPLNVIPQSQPENFGNNINQGFIAQSNNNNINNQDNTNNQNNNFFNNNINPNFNNGQYNNNLNTNINQQFNNEITRESILNNDEIVVFQSQNKFITENKTNTSLNDLNIEGDYNGLPKVDYSQDPKVIENLKTQNKKNTIIITEEAKIFLIIIAVLLLFTFVMPIIFDLIRNIQY
jgi:hypothetical protein